MLQRFRTNTLTLVSDLYFLIIFACVKYQMSLILEVLHPPVKRNQLYVHFFPSIDYVIIFFLPEKYLECMGNNLRITEFSHS